MTIEVFVVLSEDQYETRFGDGYFAYFAGAFRTRAEADAFIQGAKFANPKLMVGYHVRSGALTRDVAGAWTLAAKLEAGERSDTNGDGVLTDAAGLAASLGA